VTVRQKLDQLTSEPPVGDLGYAPDQRFVASLMLGLQLLADEIDDLKRRPPIAGQSTSTQSDEGRPTEAIDIVYEVDGVDDVATQLTELTDQLKKLTKAVKKASKRR
jgi:hypothetical protein